MPRLTLCLFMTLVGACAAAQARVDPPRAAIELRRVRVRDIDPLVRRQCAGAVEGALRRHGFVLAEGGVRLDVAVAFWDQTAFASTSSASSAADFTATLHDRTPPRQIEASGAGNDGRAAGGLMSSSGWARYSACEAGAERMAIALVEERGTQALTSGARSGR